MKVSVCVPVYNVEKQVGHCARSLFEQTLGEGIEFIFVNDCSTDRSESVICEVLEEYPARRAQVKIIRNDVNSGQDVSRNVALRVATGEYVICCDSDDWVDPDLYERMMRKAESGFDVVCCRTVVEYEGRKTYSPPVEEQTAAKFLHDGFCTDFFNSMCNKMFRRAVLPLATLVCIDHRASHEDMLMAVQFLLRCGSVGFCDGSYYHYVRSPTGMTYYYELEDAHFIARALERILPEEYAHCLMSYKHAELLTLLNRRWVSGRFFRAQWPEALGVRQILGDTKLSGLKKLTLLAARRFCLPVNALMRLRFLLMVRLHRR